MSISSNIRTGIWRNYAAGPVLGATITLTDTAAIALIAFLAVLITHTSGRSFKFLRYILYQFRDHESPRDAFARQQDLLLCNGDTDMGVLTRLVQMAWKWREVTGTRAWRRSAGLAAVAFLHFACWTAAGVASAFVAETRNQWVTVKGEQCGAWVIPENGTLAAVSDWQRERLRATTVAQAYVRLCYGEQDIGKSECKVLPRRRLEWSAVHNTSCPWPGMCAEGPNSAFRMDTGLQSSAVLGINSKTDMKWQRTMTCAPLVTEGYRELHPKSGAFGEDVWHWNYGPVAFISNSTHQVSTYEAVTSGLQLHATTATRWIGNGTLALSPIPELSRDDGDLTLLFFSAFGITFYSPSDDPIFPAHTHLQDFTIPEFKPFPTYHMDEPATVLGCFEQMRICNSHSEQCSPFSAIVTHPSATPAPPADGDDVAALLLMYIFRMPIYLSIISAGQTVLALNDGAYAGAVNTIAREQWKLEASHLFDIGLATAQSEIVMAAKLSYPQHRDGMTNVLPDEYNHTCAMVMFHETGFTSISVFGLGLIMAACTVVMAMSVAEEPLGERVWGLGRARRWRMDGLFWLLRAIWEEKGFGEWRGGWDEVPVTVGVEVRLGEEWKGREREVEVEDGG